MVSTTKRGGELRHLCAKENLQVSKVGSLHIIMYRASDLYSSAQLLQNLVSSTQRQVVPWHFESILGGILWHDQRLTGFPIISTSYICVSALCFVVYIQQLLQS